MKLLKRISNMSILELQELQEAVLTEIQRRKFNVLGGPAVESVDRAPTAAPAPATSTEEPEVRNTLPLPNRRVSRNPRRLRRAA